MALVPYTNIEDGADAGANDINGRFGDVLGQVNGNLDASNIRNGSLTRELFAADAFQAMWPVNSVYISVENVNPSSKLGGTWVAFASGRTLVGVDVADTDFNVAEKTSGSKTVTLTPAQMPSHSHTGSTSASGDHAHSFARDVVVTAASGSARAGSAGGQQVAWGQMGSTNSGGNHAHSFTTSNSGSDEAHSNVQPSIAVYFWKRVL